MMRMKIQDDFIRKNQKVEILSHQGKATKIPIEWQPVLTSCDMLVAIPDIHMYVYKENADNFKYGANALLNFLGYLSKLKREFALKGKRLRIYQLGDLFEMRFHSPANSASNATPSEIMMSHQTYSKIINTMTHINTHFLYGNHDFELRHFPGFSFGVLEGKVYLEHGFTPDAWSDFANPRAPLWEPAQFVFKTFREIESFFAKLLVAAKIIEPDEHFAIGVPSGDVERGDYPSEEEYPEKQKEYYTNRLINRSNGSDARICIIGHTHHPYFNTNVNEGSYFFVDAGAWTSGRSDFVVATNEEIAICRYRR